MGGGEAKGSIHKKIINNLSGVEFIFEVPARGYLRKCKNRPFERVTQHSNAERDGKGKSQNKFFFPFKPDLMGMSYENGGKSENNYFLSLQEETLTKLNAVIGRVSRFWLRNLNLEIRTCII